MLPLRLLLALITENSALSVQPSPSPTLLPDSRLESGAGKSHFSWSLVVAASEQ